jgi:ribonuclease HI
MKITIFTDGGITGENKEDQPCYSAYIATCDSGYGELASRSKVDKGTSNQAEYRGLLLAIEDLPELLEIIKSNCEDTEVEFKSDSKIMVNQLNGTFKTKDPKLKILKDLAKEKLSQIDNSVKISFTHVKRELNPLTDLLCNLAKQDIIKCEALQTLKTFKTTHNLNKYKALKDV